MGRSVSYPANAIVAYATFDGEPEDFQWEVIETFQDRAARLFPSLEADDRWIGREDHAVLSNRLAFAGVSEYCGIVAYWIVPRDDADQPALAEHWIEKVAERFEATFGEVRRLGTFSNGEGVYERLAA